jgi:hypothetical protein
MTGLFIGIVTFLIFVPIFGHLLKRRSPQWGREIWDPETGETEYDLYQSALHGCRSALDRLCAHDVTKDLERLQSKRESS